MNKLQLFVLHQDKVPFSADKTIAPRRLSTFISERFEGNTLIFSKQSLILCMTIKAYIRQVMENTSSSYAFELVHKLKTEDKRIEHSNNYDLLTMTKKQFKCVA